MRRICVAIGVSRAEGLAPLRAAASAAEEVGEWAERSGFAQKADIRVLTDRKDPVTIERVAQALRELLPMGIQTDALLLHFAGHGLREDNTRTLWLPTNWRSQLRAIAVERLKNRLSDFGIANVTIISDACKALANDKDTSDLTPDGVLGAGTSAGTRPVFDRYDAVHDVETAFMIPGSTPAQSRCLFSGALIEALWGATPAIDAHFTGKVTPGSLADYLSLRVAELCKTYDLDCEPQCLPGRPADHIIYFDRAHVDAGVIPDLPAWPAPAPDLVPTVAIGGDKIALPDAIEKDAFGADSVALGDYGEFSINPSSGIIEGDGLRAQITRSILGKTLGGTNPDIGRFERRIQLPNAARVKLDMWVNTMSRAPAAGLGTSADPAIAWLRTKARGDIERTVLEGSRAGRRDAAASAFFIKNMPEPYEANLLFGGAPATAIWAKAPVKRVAHDYWRADVDMHGQQLVVEYDDGIFVPVLVYQGLSTIAARDERGTNGWLFSSPGDADGSMKPAVDILARMQAGELPPSEVDEVTAILRSSKHGNPVLGAICAYLYDYAGDLDNIHRMAFFYTERGQPIPYDIALMGELDARFGSSGLEADVPAVKKRPGADIEALPDFVTRGTPAAIGAVGGLCPWLRQGWDFVDAPTDREVPLVQALPEIRTHLLAETFTSFDREGGKILTKHWGMERWL